MRLERAHGLLFLAPTDEHGNPIPISAARPGVSSGTTTARYDGLTGKLRDHGLGALAGLGVVGLDDDPGNPTVVTGCRSAGNRPLTSKKEHVDQLIVRERAACEPGRAAIRNWHILTELRPAPKQATHRARTLLVLTRGETLRGP